MQFLVTKAARECGIVNPVVCIIKNVKWDNKTTVYEENIKTVMERINEIKEKVLPSQEVQGFRELYKEIGREVIPAGERLLTSFEKGFKKISNLVDAYNLIAFETVSPFGMHDAKTLLSNGTLIFKRAAGDEKMVPAFKKDEVTIPEGDFTYGIKVGGNFTPFAWLGKEDVDSKKFQLGKKSKELLFTAIGNKHTSLERNKELCEKVFELIKKSCPEAKLEIITPTFVEVD